jgi:hypothetical protein
VAALPKLNFTRGDDASAPKLLTGSRTRKASVLKVSAQRLTAVRRASAMLMSGRVFGPPSTSQDAQDETAEKAFTALRGARTSSMDSTYSDDVSDTTSTAGAAAPAGGATADTTSNVRPFDAQVTEPSTGQNTFTPVVPLCTPPRSAAVGAFKHRDSAAVALSGAEMAKLRGRAGAGNPVGGHRRLSVALNPYKQQPAAIQAGEMNSSTTSAATGRTGGLASGGVTRQGSDGTLESFSASLTLESSSIATAETSQLLDAPGSHVSGAHVEGHHSMAEEPPKIVVDSLILLPKTQVIVGKSVPTIIKVNMSFTECVSCLSGSRCL